MNPLLLTDGYKTSHNKQYPKGTTLVYSNFTPRSNKYAPKGCNEVVVFGTQMVMMQLHEMFQKDFFNKPISFFIRFLHPLSQYLSVLVSNCCRCHWFP